MPGAARSSRTKIPIATKSPGMRRLAPITPIIAFSHLRIWFGGGTAMIYAVDTIVVR
jgi:hypothetical protein